MVRKVIIKKQLVNFLTSHGWIYDAYRLDSDGYCQRRESLFAPRTASKSLFLLAQNLTHDQLNVETFYSFVPYDYGPFRQGVHLDAESLEDNGLVAINRPPETRYKQHAVTEAGAKKARELESGIDKKVLDYAHAVVRLYSIRFLQPAPSMN